MAEKKRQNAQPSLTIWGDAGLVGKLNAIADREGVSRSLLVRSALEEFVKKYQEERGEVTPHASKKRARRKP